METLLVRLKPYDPRRGHVLRRYTYDGIRFQPERGWYRVEKRVGDYLRTVHQQPSDDFTPLAFDVCTDAEAKALEAAESDDAKVARSATDDIKVAPSRTSGALTTEELPKPAAAAAHAVEERGQRNRKDKE
jgi:hypothetical protein